MKTNTRMKEWVALFIHFAMSWLGMMFSYICAAAIVLGIITVNPVLTAVGTFGIYVGIKQTLESTGLMITAVGECKHLCQLYQYYAGYYNTRSSKENWILFGGQAVLSTVLGYSLIWVTLELAITFFTWPAVSKGITVAAKYVQNLRKAPILILAESTG